MAFVPGETPFVKKLAPLKSGVAVILLTLGLGLFAPANVEAAFRMPGWACRTLLMPSEEAKFQMSEFELAQEKWARELPQKFEDESIRRLESVIEASSGPEEVLAYIEAVSSRLGSQLFDIGKAFRADPKRGQRFASELQKVIASGDVFGTAGTSRIVAELYALSHLSKRPLWQRVLPLPVKEAMAARVTQELEREILSEAFRKLGFFREPNRLQHFQRWVGQRSYLWEVPLLAGTYTLSKVVLRKGWTFGLNANLLNWRSVPLHWVPAYQEGGLAAIEPLYRKRFWLLGHLDYGWEVFQTAVGAAFGATVVFYVASDPAGAVDVVDWTIYGIRANFADLSVASLQKAADDAFDCLEMRKKKVKDWTASYEAFEERPLSPKSDPEAWRLLKEKIMKVPCDELRVRLGRE